MIYLNEVEFADDLTNIDVDKEYKLSSRCQKRVFNDLLKVEFIFFGTIQFN